jgi:hypothetical protein
VRIVGVGAEQEGGERESRQGLEDGPWDSVTSCTFRETPICSGAHAVGALLLGFNCEGLLPKRCARSCANPCMRACICPSGDNRAERVCNQHMASTPN